MIFKTDKLIGSICNNTDAVEVCGNYLDKHWIGISQSEFYFTELYFAPQNPLCEFMVYSPVAILDPDGKEALPDVSPLYLKYEITGYSDENFRIMDRFDIKKFYVVKQMPSKGLTMLNQDIIFDENLQICK